MSKPNGPKLSMNVLVNKQKSKVLFAEANSHVVDVLLSFLTLPLGKIMKILENHYGDKAPVVGSLTTLRRGLANLDSTSFCVGGAKQMFLNPRSSSEVECSKLKLDISDSQPTKYFVCRDLICPHSKARNISFYSDVIRCDCGRLNNTEIIATVTPADEAGGGFLTINDSFFIICDDLRVVPAVSGLVQTLNSVGITTDADGAELISYSFGINDVMDLLNYSLMSATPLTDLVIKNSKMNSSKHRVNSSSHHIEKEAISNSSKKMILKVSWDKKTNKLLFVQATGEFVEFLFSFLALPLGGVEYLSGGKTCLDNIDNLYRSVSDVINDGYFNTREAKSKLINPKQPHGSVSENQFLPLCEQSPPAITQQKLLRWSSSWCEAYVKKQKSFIVSDDLTVIPFSIAHSISIVNGLGVPLSDVRETELQIGLEEALSILKASLTSTTALSDSLKYPMLKKKILKVEHQPSTVPIRLVGEII